MKFIIDNQLPPALVLWLEAKGHEAAHVYPHGLAEKDDSVIWDHAEREGAAVITKDADFALRRVREQSGPVVVWLRIGNATTPALLAWLEAVWLAVEDELAAGSSVIEVR